MKKLIIVGISLMMLCSLAAVANEYVEGELIVQIHSEYANENDIAGNLLQLQADFEKQELKFVRELTKRVRIWQVVYNPKVIKANDMLSLVKKHYMIEEAQFNHYVQERATLPNDQYFPQQWALHNTGQGGGVEGADIGATLAWDITTGGETADGKEIVVAVIDNGFALTHSDLNFWTNDLEIPGNGIDDDGNGYIDDYQGWNSYADNGILPAVNHGTHVCGIIGAKGNNELGITGINWGLRILPIAGSSSNEAIVIASYGYALDMRARYNETEGQEGAYIVATNSSFGVNNGRPERYPLWAKMYDEMGEQGILSVVSTMNVNANVDDVGDMPSSCTSPYIISVTSTDKYDSKSASAAYGRNSIDLGAPGAQIYSTITNNGYGTLSGTSMACPHVTGAVALMYSAASERLLNAYESDPSGLALLMKRIIMETVDPLPSLSGRTVSGGRLNLYESVLKISDLLDNSYFPAPSNLMASYKQNKVNLEWSQYGGRTPEYNLIYRDGEVINTIVGYRDTYVDKEAKRGESYQYNVVAGYLDPDGESSFSDTAIITIPPDFPILIYPGIGEHIYDDHITLEWEDVYGAEYYQLTVGFDQSFTHIIRVPGVLETNSYTIPYLDEDTVYYWRVKSVNEGGESEWSPVYHFVTIESDVDTVPIVPQNSVRAYPNPFIENKISRSNALTIEYENSEPTNVSIKIYNIKGQLIKELYNGYTDAGLHNIQWNWESENNQQVVSGLYLLKYQSSNYQEIKKILYYR